MTSQVLTAEFGIRLLWLRKRAPQLNPVDTLWGQGKDANCANKQHASMAEQGAHFIHHLTCLPDAQAMQPSGIQSKHFCFKQAL
jgi:hypothetical protein